MTEERIEYDADQRLIKVYRGFDKAKTLVPKKELKRWTNVVDAGHDDKGRDVDAVRYVFSDEKTAEYNHQRVGFANLETFVLRDGEEKPWGDEPNFSVREDF